MLTSIKYLFQESTDLILLSTQVSNHHLHLHPLMAASFMLSAATSLTKSQNSTSAPTFIMVSVDQPHETPKGREAPPYKNSTSSSEKSSSPDDGGGMYIVHASNLLLGYYHTSHTTLLIPFHSFPSPFSIPFSFHSFQVPHCFVSIFIHLPSCHLESVSPMRVRVSIVSLLHQGY